jgi:hypothetical protein
VPICPSPDLRRLHWERTQATYFVFVFRVEPVVTHRMYCNLSRLIVQPRFSFPLSSPEALHVNRRKRPLSAEGGTIGEKFPIKFSHIIATSTVILGFLYMPQSCDMGPTALLPPEGRHAEDFFTRKIRRLRPGLNPRTWVPEVSMLTTSGAPCFVRCF